jgi:hypothetical protein
MITVKATFIGTNSLGYETGKEYDLKVSGIAICFITRADGTGACQYSSATTFLKNWNNIKHVK